ncbi:hypothetical protein M8C21_013547 [Ambrosia artemisiifolia]|nr:hypothetical protein M8C21_013547 [Ambrosia artemisiifolia]
MGLVLSG